MFRARKEYVDREHITSDEISVNKIQIKEGGTLTFINNFGQEKKLDLNALSTMEEEGQIMQITTTLDAETVAPEELEDLKQAMVDDLNAKARRGEITFPTNADGTDRLYNLEDIDITAETTT